MMRRARRKPDSRQREMLLVVNGQAAPALAPWIAALFDGIAALVARYGKPQIAVWAGVDQRSVEHWLSRRHLPSLESAVALAAQIPEFAAALQAAWTSFETPSIERARA